MLGFATFWRQVGWLPMSWRVKPQSEIHREIIDMQHSPGPPPGLCFGGGMFNLLGLWVDSDQSAA
jgi:hypothetical protein